MRRLAAAQSGQIPMAGAAIPKFVDPLPGLAELGLIDARAGTGSLHASQIALNMAEFQAQVLPTSMPKTWVWGYLHDGQTARSTYLGPIVLAQRGNPVEMKFINKLGFANSTNVDAYKYGTDQTLHWADPVHDESNYWNKVAIPPPVGSEGAENYLGPIPACVHLHGGEVPPQLDGGPDAWYTGGPDAYQAHAFYSADGAVVAAVGGHSIYRYPNSQEGALIWFHDHTLGATRLNVYCGLAGGYLIVDPENDPPNLPDRVPLIIQDRMFDTNGQLFFPSDSAAGLVWTPNPEHPYWVPEFVGDVICVNGKAWPYMEVAPKRYTFLFLNGSNARSYEMFLIDPVSGNRGPAFWVVGTDGGYLDKPVRVGPPAANNNNLVMMSGERYMVIVDFAGFQAGSIGPNGLPYSGTWLLKNQAKTPFPNGAAAIGATTAQIMQFRVSGTPGQDSTFNPAAPRATLRSGTAGQPNPVIVRLVDPVAGTLKAGTQVQLTRQLTLNEVMGMPQNAINPVTGLNTAYPGGPLEILVNNTKLSGNRITGVNSNTPPEFTMEPVPGFIMDFTGKNFVSELPKEGETEVWELVNLTADAHPIHLHLVQFQLMNRQDFDTKVYNAAYAKAFTGGGYDPQTGGAYAAHVYIPGFGPPNLYDTGGPVVGGNPDINEVGTNRKPLYLKGAPTPPLPQEAGWKDTIIVYPRQVTRIVVRWAPTDLVAATPPASAAFPFDPSGGLNTPYGYVWHCHIVDHEDNEMMRPDEVIANSAATRTFVMGTDF
jgi:FtsP/CotA-like multicopper oxidase with cupredoxin domain